MENNQKLRLKFLNFIGVFYFSFLIFAILAFIFGVMVLFALIGRVIALNLIIKLSIPLVIFCAYAFKGFFSAIFSKIPEPNGIELKKNDAKELFKYIDDIRIQSGCRKIHSIKVNFEMNAFILEQPRLGILGWYKRYLVIGIPLLIMLTEQELKAIISHECGHLSKSHGKDGVSIYRSKLIWSRIAEELKKDGKDKTFFVRIFMNRYIPALNDILFEMKKQHEFEADRIAAYVAGKEALISSLLKLSIYDALLMNTFWTNIDKLNLENEFPPKDLFINMEIEIQKPLSEDFINPAIEKLISYQSLPASSHPSIVERIEALGAEVTKIDVTLQNALRTILPNQADLLIEKWSKTWAAESEKYWSDRYNVLVDLKERLRLLNEKNNNELDISSIKERLSLLETIGGVDTALTAYKKAEEQYPNDIVIKYNIGRLLLCKANDEGIEVLNEVMNQDCQTIPYCCSDIVNYLCYKNKKDLASQYYYYALDFMTTNDEVSSERDKINLNDTFVPHDLSYESVINLINIISKYSDVKKAYVFIKQINLSSQFPIYIIGLVFKSGATRSWEETYKQMLEEKMLPWECWLFNLNQNRGIEYIATQIPGSRII